MSSFINALKKPVADEATNRPDRSLNESTKGRLRPGLAALDRISSA